jgi:hypothetical protein
MANIPLKILAPLASMQIPNLALKLEAWLKVDRAANNGPSRSAERSVNTCMLPVFSHIGRGGVNLTRSICTTDSRNLWGLADGEVGTEVRIAPAALCSSMTFYIGRWYSLWFPPTNGINGNSAKYERKLFFCYSVCRFVDLSVVESSSSCIWFPSFCV